MINNENKDGQFVKIKSLAQRYGVCERTIKKWKDAGLLIYIQVKRVVRFDVGACDESLRNNNIISPI
jgi:hypothetical protein